MHKEQEKKYENRRRSPSISNNIDADGDLDPQDTDVIDFHDTKEVNKEELRWLFRTPIVIAPTFFCGFCFACLFGYIYGSENHYTPNDWQRCLVIPNLGNLHLDQTHFCTSAANFVGQCYIGIFSSLVGSYLALARSNLIPFGLYLNLLGILFFLVYRESYPYFVDPHYMSSTLLTLNHFIQPDMFKDLYPGKVAWNNSVPNKIIALLQDKLDTFIKGLAFSYSDSDSDLDNNDVDFNVNVVGLDLDTQNNDALSTQNLFTSMNQLLQQFGIGKIQKKMIVAFLKKNYDIIMTEVTTLVTNVHEKVVGRVGWTKGMFSVANENTCDKTYDILRGYLANMWLIFAISILLTLFSLRAYYKSIRRGEVVACLGKEYLGSASRQQPSGSSQQQQQEQQQEKKRQGSSSKFQHPQHKKSKLWKGHFMLMFVVTWMLLSEIVMISSKEHAAETAITLLVKNNLSSTYPFLDNNLDIVSLTTLLSIGGGIYALCTKSRHALYLTLLSSFIHVTRSFPGLLGTLSAYFSIVYPWSDPENNISIDTNKTIMYHGRDQDTYSLWSNQQCTKFVQETNLMQFFTPNTKSNSGLTGDQTENPLLIPQHEDLASQICFGLEFSMAAQMSCWISTLTMIFLLVFMIRINFPSFLPPSITNLTIRKPSTKTSSYFNEEEQNDYKEPLLISSTNN